MRSDLRTSVSERACEGMWEVGRRRGKVGEIGGFVSWALVIFRPPFFVGKFEYKMSNTYSKLQMKVFHGRPYLQTCFWFNSTEAEFVKGQL